MKLWGASDWHLRYMNFILDPLVLVQAVTH